MPTRQEALDGPNGERITLELVTPSRANELLALNTENYRRSRRSLIDKYSDDMVKGHWRFTGDTLKVDANGVFADGQNRLLAQVKSNTSLWWLIVWKMDPAAVMVVDTGAARTAADHLKHKGMANASMASAIARLSIGMTDKSKKAISVSEISEWIGRDEFIPHVCTQINGMSRLKRIVTPATIGYVWWLLHQVDAFKAAEFFWSLEKLENQPKGSPILALDRRLAAIKRERSGWGRGREEQMATMIYAWNAWIRGESREILRTIERADGGGIYMPKPLAPLDAADEDVADEVWDESMEAEQEPAGVG